MSPTGHAGAQRAVDQYGEHVATQVVRCSANNAGCWWGFRWHLCSYHEGYADGYEAGSQEDG